MVVLEVATVMVVEFSWRWWWGSHCGVEVGFGGLGGVMEVVVGVEVVVVGVVVVELS